MTVRELTNGDLVEVDADNIRAFARVRETSGGRLHLALELGAYLPWSDAAVLVRPAGSDGSETRTARILHAGATSALLQVIEMVQEVAAPARPALATQMFTPDASSIDDDW